MNFYNYLIKGFFLFLILFSLKTIKAQNNFFHVLEVGSEVWDNEKWTVNISGNWKQLYKSNNWTRLGLSGTLTRKLKQWAAQGGVNNYYTINKYEDNLWEIRPSLGIGLSTSVVKKLSFKQRLLSEWRFFFYENKTNNQNPSKDNYARLRYRIGLHYILHKNQGSPKTWAITGNVEFYFLKEPTTGERFSNSTEYTLKLARTFIKKNQLVFGYTLEKFKNNIFSDTKTGHTLTITYNL